MNKCIRIEFDAEIGKDFLHKKILKKAREALLEGVAYQTDAGGFKIVLCGSNEALDDFLDFFHKEMALVAVNELEILPFLKDKDYRGIFRVIE